LQQFAVAFYGPVVAAGFATWHRESSNYWGHNAIIRTRAFAQSAALPSLSGRPPLGGHVQSHDFIEAAFLRRAGWEVWMRADLLGSYEGCPPTLIDVAVRDRRWAQGNLQHMRIIGAKALPWVSRFHLGMGTYAYISSVLWALSLIVGVILAVQSQYTLPVYFGEQRSLFPIWPVIDPLKAFYLFLATLVVVLLPKILGIVSAFLRRDVATRTPAWFMLGALVETVFSILFAPVLMFTQTQAVIEVLMGRDSGWGGQKRNASSTQLAEAVRFHRWHTLVGIILMIICAMVSIHVTAWMGPILLGLLLSIGLSAATSATPPGWLARTLATAEDIQLPKLVAKVERLHRQWSDLLGRAPGVAKTETSITG
jgi:membrane glycosyltransferase